MRISNQSADRGRLRGRSRALLDRSACLIAVGLFVAACASANSAPTATPVPPRPTPVITPNPHLVAPASAEVVFNVLARAGMPISGNNATAGKDPVKSISATYDGWPMRLSEYRSAASLAKAKPWKASDRPGKGESPVAMIGLNILIEWGPTTGSRPPRLGVAQIQAMNELLKVMDPYIGPLTVRTTTQLAVPVATPPPTPRPSAPASASAAPSKGPGASPSGKPKASP